MPSPDPNNWQEIKGCVCPPHFFCASNLYNYSLTTRLPHLPPGAVMPMAPSSYILAHEAFVKPIIVAKFFSVLFLLFENA